MIAPIRRWFATRRLTRAVRKGVGLRERSWDLPLQDDDAAALLVDEILSWAREAVAGMRRPYGLDYVAVAFACRNPDGRVICSNALGVVRPAIFYGDEGARRVEGFVRDVRVAGPEEGARIIGALLSLGDVAHELGVPSAA